MMRKKALPLTDRQYQLFATLGMAFSVVALCGLAVVLFYDRSRYLETLRHWISPAPRVERVAPSDLKEFKPAASQDVAVEVAPPKDGILAEKRLNSPVDSPLPSFKLILEPAAIAAVEQQVRHSIAVGRLVRSDHDWHKAVLVTKDASYKVKVRLRGDLGAHWKGAHKSWRVRFQKDELFNGIRELDLIVADDKALEIERLAQVRARAMGLIGMPSGFVVLDVNHQDRGVYYWLEQPNKEMLEKLNLPDGEIFSGANTWLDDRFTRFGGGYEWGSYPAGWEANIHRQGAVANAASDQLSRMLELLRDADGARFAREIPRYLDVDKVAAYSALLWQFGSAHAQAEDNLKLYFNASTGRFEPIAYDVFVYRIGEWKGDVLTGAPRGAFDNQRYSALIKRTLSDRRVTDLRNRFLWEQLRQEKQLIAEAHSIYRQIRPALAASGRNIDDEDARHAGRVDMIQHNATLLRDWLSFSRLFIEPSIATTGEISLKMVPDGLAAIDIRSVSLPLPLPNGSYGGTVHVLGGSRNVVKAEVTATVDKGVATIRLPDISIWADRGPGTNIELRATPWDFRLQFADLKAVPADWFPDQRKVAVDAVNRVSGMPVPERMVRVSGMVLSRNSGSTFGNMTKFIRAGQDVIIPAGTHRIDSTVTLPVGVNLTIEPGARLVMGPGASIRVLGGLSAEGRADAPIIIEAADPQKPWGVLAVVNDQRSSNIRHLDISGGSEAWLDGAFFSGQLALHGGSVDMANSRVHGARADDGLNIKKASVTLKNVVFRDNSSDGFDGDFVVGQIKNCQFLNNGGDGLDVSGAQVAVIASDFDGMGDKGISVGENSEVVIFRGRIVNSKIGIASKDLSLTHVYGSLLGQNRTALSAYQKKPIFGPGRIEVYGGAFVANEVGVDVEGASRVAIHGAAADDLPARPDVALDSLRPLPRPQSPREALREALSFLAATAGPSTRPIQFQGIDVPDLSTIPLWSPNP
ncbi:MAG: CotH kinase family protein [Alphaproteobacteria bacterium]|nr:CotH kinase family protein [Alphaproteobacteria bacterium]